MCVWGGEEVILLDVEGQTEMPEQVQFHVLSACSFTLLSKVVKYTRSMFANPSVKRSSQTLHSLPELSVSGLLH